MELSKYSTKEEGDKRMIRFRDWDNLHYIFRAFEEFTPWVRKIHFITWGHLPSWLNVEHPKLNIIKHGDYIEAKYLPIFNSHPLEVNMHKINGLSEQFVYFNDDFFLTRPVTKERFFKNDLPCDQLVFNIPPSPTGVGYYVFNAVGILNENIDKLQVMKKHFKKWFYPYFGAHFFRTLYLALWPRFTGFYSHHQPQPFLKKTFIELWEKEPKLLEQTMRSKFRRCSDLSQYLFRYWQLVKGDFIPVSMKDTKYIPMDMDMIRSGEISQLITEHKFAMLSLNDTEDIGDNHEFEEAKKILQEAFEKILPNKSSFEL